MYHRFLIHSSVDEHLGFFHVLAITNSAAMNIGVHMSLSLLVSSAHTPFIMLCSLLHGCCSHTTPSFLLPFSPAVPSCCPGDAGRSSVLAWRIPGTGEPCGLPSMGSHRVRHDWSDLAATLTENIHAYLYTEETRRERDTCTPMFIAALFVIARTWKQPRCPSADEWIRKLWYILEYYSAIKKNTFESVLMRWMKLEPIIQSELSQKEKHQYSILTHIYGI